LPECSQKRGSRRRGTDGERAGSEKKLVASRSASIPKERKKSKQEDGAGGKVGEAKTP